VLNNRPKIGQGTIYKPPHKKYRCTPSLAQLRLTGRAGHNDRRHLASIQLLCAVHVASSFNAGRTMPTATSRVPTVTTTGRTDLVIERAQATSGRASPRATEPRTGRADHHQHPASGRVQRRSNPRPDASGAPRSDSAPESDRSPTATRHRYASRHHVSERQPDRT
jgi:hypothetical protein